MGKKTIVKACARPALYLMALLATALCLCAGAAAEENDEVLHYLLLGEDGYASDLTDDARTDTIVLVSLDEKYNRVLMTSILRDCAITTPRGTQTKANLLYRAYGFDGVIASVESALQIDIEGAVLVNFENVKPVIDALGGVDIEIDQMEYYAIRRILLGEDPNMPSGPGLVHMTGRIALAYMRDRTSGNDFTRTAHQREVVRQLLQKCADLSLFDLVGVYNAVSGGVRTNLSALDILSALSRGYALLSGGATFAEYRIPQDGLYSYGSIGSSSVLNVNWRASRERFRALLNEAP